MVSDAARLRVLGESSDGALAVELHLRAPMVLLPGDRFILRGFARTAMGGATLGGGSVLDVAPPHRRRPGSARYLHRRSSTRPARGFGHVYRPYAG